MHENRNAKKTADENGGDVGNDGEKMVKQT